MIRLRRAHITGFVDGLKGSTVRGWAADKNALDDVLDITIIADGRSIAEGRASELRPDLAAAGYGQGRHGFKIVLPEIPPAIASLQVLASHPDRQHVKAPLRLTADASIQITRLHQARLQALKPPKSIYETCGRVRDGRFDGLHRAPTDVERLYFSDELLMRTIMAFVEKA